MSNRRLALDGPSNGMYITAAVAAEQGYASHKWPSLESVWIHGEGAHTLAEDYDPDPVYTTVLEAVFDAEVR